MAEASQCPKCGSAVGADANFCPACGSALERREPDRTEALPVVRPGAGDVPMLVVVRGANAGSRFEIGPDDTTIGRHPQSTVFLDDVTVSRRHALIAVEGPTCVLSDAGSLNGTYVNGALVERHALNPGDQIQVGKFRLLFALEAGDGDR